MCAFKKPFSPKCFTFSCSAGRRWQTNLTGDHGGNFPVFSEITDRPKLLSGSTFIFVILFLKDFIDMPRSKIFSLLFTTSAVIVLFNFHVAEGEIFLNEKDFWVRLLIKHWSLSSCSHFHAFSHRFLDFFVTNTTKWIIVVICDGKLLGKWSRNGGKC